MNRRTIFPLFALLLFCGGSAKSQQKCDCTLFPRDPDYCVKECALKALNLATPLELKVNLHFDPKVVVVVKKARKNGPITSLDNLRESLTADQFSKLEKSVNSEEGVKPIFAREEKILGDVSQKTLEDKYKLDTETARGIVDAREDKSGGRMTLEDLKTKLSDAQIQKVQTAIAGESMKQPD
ncbi:MAG: hypothetical protein ABSA70_15535 [Terriglobia bacterium]